MIVETDSGPIRLAARAPQTRELTADEGAWISFLRDLGEGSTPPPTLAMIQNVRRALGVFSASP